jgi:hypothetical protein
MFIQPHRDSLIKKSTCGRANPIVEFDQDERQLLRRQWPPAAASAYQPEELLPAVKVEGTEEVVELRQQRGEVAAGRRHDGDGAEDQAHREQRRRR